MNTARALWPDRLRAAVQRMLLWNIRTQIVAPFNETVLQVFARISSYRDSLDGPQVPRHSGSKTRLPRASSAMRLLT